jgi:hypothetical protein
VIVVLALLGPLAVSVRVVAGPSTAAAAGDPVIAAAGDISCDPANTNWNGGNGTSNACRQLATSDLIVNGNFAAALPLGDNQYECGSLWGYQNSYDLSWGRFKSITRPSPGNHDYLTHGGTDCTTANAGAAGYYNYFGPLAGTVAPGKGYYSYDIGAWHLISLNSNCGDAGGCSPSTPQGKWLAADLAAHASQCILAYWHIPLFSSGGRASSNSQSFWNALYAAHADVILTGHDHIYERFAPQTPSGQLDNVAGIRQFIAGTGGNNHTSIANVAANSLVRDTTAFGVLELTLHPGSYDWQFVPAAGGAFTDAGSGTCHNASTDHTPPTDPANLNATTAGTSEIDLVWTGSTDNTDVSGYRIYRDDNEIGTSTTTSYADKGLVPGTAYSYQVRAYDSSGNQSGFSNTSGASTDSDSTPPTAPANLTAAPGATSGIDLSWGKSTDDSGIDHYVVVRDGGEIDTAPSRTSTTYAYSDTGVDPGTTHTYVVRAVDLAGNPSADSNPAAATAPNTLTFTAVADTWVQDISPTTNYGAQPSVGVDGSPVKHILLRFDVAGLGGRPVLSAKLRVYCVDPSSLGGELHRVANTSWNESTVTWNTAPGADPGVLRTIGSVQAGNWYELDVTPAVSGEGPISFEALSTSTDGADYSSKEGLAGFAPQLVITTTSGGGSSSPPSQPTLGLGANDGNDYVNGSTVFYRSTGSTSGSFTVTASADASTTHVQFPAVFGGDSADDTTSPYSQTYSWGAGANVSGSFQVTAANAFGNSPPASFTVTKDVTAPATTIACNGIANCTGTYSGAVNITLSSNDGSGSGPQTIYYTTDGSTPTTSSTVYTAPFGVPAGATVGFFAVDNVGNAETPKSQLVTAGSGGSGIALVRQTPGSTTAASLTVTPSAASTAGDTLVAAVAIKAGTSASVTSVTDSAGGTWTKGPSSATSGVEDRVEIWYRLGAPSVSSVTINLSASKSFAANVSEWSGIHSVISLAGGTNVSSTTAATPVQANVGAPYVVIGAVNYPANVSSSLAAGPFTGLLDFSVSTTVHGRAAYVITPTNGSFQAVCNLSGLSGGSAGVTLALGAA